MSRPLRGTRPTHRIPSRLRPKPASTTEADRLLRALYCMALTLKDVGHHPLVIAQAMKGMGDAIEKGELEL